MSSNKDANWQTEGSNFAWPNPNASYTEEAFQQQQIYPPGYGGFNMDGASYAPAPYAYTQASTSYTPNYDQLMEAQLARLQAAYPGYSKQQILQAIAPSQTYSAPSQSPASYHTQAPPSAAQPPNSFAASTLDSSLNSALAFTPPTNTTRVVSEVTAAPLKALPTIEKVLLRKSTSPPAATKAPPVKKVAQKVSAEDALWGKIKPHLSRLRVERDPATSARDIMGALSELDSDGRFRKPVSTNPELREAIVQGLATIATLEKGKGFTENGRRKFLGAWISSPAGRSILANWLRQSVPPKNVTDGVTDLSKLYKTTLHPLLQILKEVPMQSTYLEDSAGPAKVLTGVISRAPDAVSKKLATQLKAKWYEIYDRAGAGADAAKSASPPITKRKAVEPVAEPTKRYKTAPVTKPAAAPVKQGLAFFSTSSVKQAPIPKKVPASKTASKSSAHQTIQALMNTYIPNEQKGASTDQSDAAQLAKEKATVKKAKRVSWRDESELVAIRWIESRDFEQQEKHDGHEDFAHEGDALKRAVSTMEEQMSWHEPRPLQLPHAYFPSAAESVEGPYQTERNGRLPAVTYTYEPPSPDESQLSDPQNSSPAPAELQEPAKEIFLPSSMLPSDGEEDDASMVASQEQIVAPAASAPVETAHVIQEEAAPAMKSPPIMVEEAGPVPPGPAPAMPPGPPPAMPAGPAQTMPGAVSTTPSGSAPPNPSDVAKRVAVVIHTNAEGGPQSKLDMSMLQSILENAKAASQTGGAVPQSAPPAAAAAPDISSLLANLSSTFQMPQANAGGAFWQPQEQQQQQQKPISSYPGEYPEDYESHAPIMQTQSAPYIQHQQPQQQVQQPKGYSTPWGDDPNMPAYVAARLHTKPCKFFASGLCFRGDKCNFIHN